MTFLYVLLPVALLVFFTEWYGGRRAADQRAKAFRERTQLQPDEWIRVYGAEFADVPRDYLMFALQEIADEHRVPVGALRPDDRYDRELAPKKPWQDWDHATSAWQEVVGDTDEVTLKELTVRNYVLLLWEREKKHKARKERRKAPHPQKESDRVAGDISKETPGRPAT